MNQKTLFDDAPAKPAEPRFDGETYEPVYDGERLATALDRVFAYLKDGTPRTLADIAAAADCSEAAASARFRDLRKDKWRRFYGVRSADSERVSGGLWKYSIKVET